MHHPIDDQARQFQVAQGSITFRRANGRSVLFAAFVTFVVFFSEAWPSSVKDLSLSAVTSATAPELHEANPSDAHWAFRAIHRPEPPKVRLIGWSRNPIDRFILTQLEAQGLAPAPEADRRTLIRRLSYGLRGLPPAPREVKAFLADPAEDAYERLVERFLRSPNYGERWARHWLDTVHYGETHGYDKDKPRPNAWPYRDYVIRAFNHDKSYARFVQEQLAGDVLFPNHPDGVVATGFIAAGPWDFVGHVELSESKTDGLIARYNDRDDMVMTTLSTFQSLTVHCARCHDHKFDPITQEDYYRLQAVFAGVDRADRCYDPDPATFARRQELRAEKQQLESRQAALDKILENQRPQSVDRALPAAIQSERQEVEEQLATVSDALTKLGSPNQVYAAANDFEPMGSFKPPVEPRPVHLLRRGDVKQPVKPMAPGTVGCFPYLASNFDLNSSSPEGDRRAALARWLTDPKNLQTRRSLVNRVWQYHFGRGIVDTPNDFGTMGSTPTHPDLLNWLAYWFMENGESIKNLHRLITTSAAYRQSSTDNPVFARIDSSNRYLWRMNRQRLDAESVRDTLLAITETLDSTMGGPSDRQFFFKDDHSPVYDYAQFDVESPESFRRSIYRFIVRSVPDPFFETLDCSDPSLLTPKRNVTITALQALALLNNPFVLSQAERLADRLARAHRDLRGQIEFAYALALSRPPTANELAAVLPYAEKHGLAAFSRLLINGNEFLFID